MNKKLAALLFGLFCLGSSKVIAAAPVFNTGANSNYEVVHATISISSSTVQIASVTAVSGYRTMDIQILPNSLMDGVSLFYRLDGSTTNIVASGYIVRVTTLSTVNASAMANVNTFTIESNRVVYFSLAPGIPTYGDTNAPGTTTTTIRARVTSKKLRQ